METIELSERPKTTLNTFSPININELYVVNQELNSCISFLHSSSFLAPPAPPPPPSPFSYLSYTYFASGASSPGGRILSHPTQNPVTPAKSSPLANPFGRPQMRKSTRGRGKPGKESGRPITVMDPMQCSIVVPGAERVHLFRKDTFKVFKFILSKSK